jgi:FMN-dependent oxidoreductase (nitrilotriacetate monooxygenase family)
MDALPPKDERYDRADEVLEACMALWKSWEPDSFVMDKKEGVFVDPSKVHYANYQGKWIKTRGPIATPPSPQGHPVIMQAGSSPRGREFAARWAEIIFTPQGDIEKMRAFYDDMQDRLVAAGRERGSCKILPGISTIIGETEAIAKERAEYLADLEAVDYNLAYASLGVGADLSKHDTEDAITKVRGQQGSHGLETALKETAEKEKVSLKEAASKGRASKAIVGTPKMVADRIQEIYEAGVADGFVLMPMMFPQSHEQFCRSVVPELQRRGLFRKEYSASTLRGNLQS